MDKLGKTFHQWSNGNAKGQKGCYAFERGSLFQHGIPMAYRRRFPSGLVIIIRDGFLNGKLETRLRPDAHFRGKRVVGVNNRDFERLSSAFAQIDKFHSRSKVGWRSLRVGDFTKCGGLLKESQDILLPHGITVIATTDVQQAAFSYLLRGHAQAVCYSPTKWQKGKYQGHQFEAENFQRQPIPSEWMAFKSMEDAIHAKLAHPPGLPFKLYEIQPRP